MINKNKNEEGALMIAVVMAMVSISLMIGIGINYVFLKELRAIEITEESINAFYAADSGLEIAMLYIHVGPGNESGEINDKSYFEFFTTNAGEKDCEAENYCIDSFGYSGKTKRTLRVRY